MKKLLKILINLFTFKSAALQGSIACAEATASKMHLSFDDIKTYTSINNLKDQIKEKIKAFQADKQKTLNLSDIKINDLSYQNKGFKFKFEIPKDKLILAEESKKTHEIKLASLQINEGLFYALNFDYKIKK